MSVKKIIFRADGNRSIGLGHLYRVFAMIEMLKNDCECMILTKADTLTGSIPGEYKRIIIPEGINIADEPEYLATEYPPAEYILVADGYQFNSEWQAAVKQNNYRLVYIDDMACEYMYADIVINHSPAAKKEDYRAEPYTRFALGTGYALLRPAFLQVAQRSRLIQKNGSAFICFGGADNYDLTSKVVKAFSGLHEIKELHVVAGAAYQDDLSLRGGNQTVKVYRNLAERELINVMLKCELAVVPASTILFELCCVKMPVLTGFYVKNQEKAYLSFVSEHIAEGVGNFIEADNTLLAESIIQLRSQDPAVFMRQQGRYFDGQQRERIRRLILNNDGY